MSKADTAQNWVTFEAKVAVRIADLKARTGIIPSAFHHCLINGCGRRAVYLLCAVSDHAIVHNSRRFAESVAEALAQELRREFDTNLEVPVCEQHLDDDGFTVRSDGFVEYVI